MLRRPQIRSVAFAAVATLGATGCATFTNTGVVAEVGGVDVTVDEFASLSDTFFGRSDIFGTATPINGRVDAEQSRSLLDSVVRQQLQLGFLDGQGIDVSDDRTQFVDNDLRPQLPDDDIPDDILELIADAQAPYITDAVASVNAPDIDALQQRYDDDPSSIGVTCVRHILVETESEARDVLAELSDGAEFADVAAARSTDEASATQGGAIASPDGECVPLETVRQGFDPAFTAGVLAGRVGVPTDPVESSFGWHVILHRPWSEVGESVGALYQTDTVGRLLFEGYKATVDIDVDPRYGSWDRITEVIEPIG